MGFELNNEKATNVLIWWVESSDGAIDFREEEAIREVLDEMQYSAETYQEETKMHISGLKTDRMKQLIDQSIQWGAEHFDEERQLITLRLLDRIAEADGKIEDEQQDKLDRIEQEFKNA